jgi:hypothetical protein
LPGQIDGDAQQAPGRAFNLNQVVTQARLLSVQRFPVSATPIQFPCENTRPKTIDQKKRAVVTRPFGREPRDCTGKNARSALILKDLS